jgi:cell division initiation protein
MKIAPQDIIDKEFRVKFRGFDMAEVDMFLEDVAENFFKLNEENTLLNEKVLALQEKMKSGGTIVSQSQMELPAELNNFLEELKQDTAAISAELASLKQDRSTFVSLEKSIKEAVASIQESASAAPQGQALPADFNKAMEEFKNGSQALNKELAALKEDRQAFDSLKKSLEEVVASAKKAGPASAPQAPAESGDLTKTLDKFRQGTEAMGAELSALKGEVGSIQKFREEIKTELQGLLKSYFDDLDTKLSKLASPAPPAGPKPKAATTGPKKEKLAEAIIEEEPESPPEDSRLPDYEEQDDTNDDGALEFLSEDDIMDVDKLRDVFQSVLDGSSNDSHNSREEKDDDSSADLLFFEDSIIDDEHEPEVSFALDDEKADNKPKNKEKA